MKHYFHQQKEKIRNFLTDYINTGYTPLAFHNHAILNIRKRLLDFTSRGKMIRGGLVALGYDLYTAAGPEPPDRENMAEEIIKTGAVLELLQSGLLVHDDIMDRDRTRRGHDTFFMQYTKEMEKLNIQDAYHTGEALGICGGDIYFFLAFKLMSELRIPRSVQLPVFSLFSGEMCRVATAQMYDVLWGSQPSMVSSSEILELYKNKTGRYTFSLPLKIGALMAGAGKTEYDALEKIGELLGMVFQIRDDDINLYGLENESGKSAGSDIKEGKKTLWISLVFEKADPYEKKKLLSFIGNHDCTEDDIMYIKNLLDTYEIPSEINSIIEELNARADTLIETINPVNKNALEIFLDLTRYNQQRKK